MDIKERAKKAVEARKRRNAQNNGQSTSTKTSSAKTRTKTTTSSTSSSTFSTSNNGIDLPKVTDFTTTPEVNTTINGNVTFDSSSRAVSVQIPGLPQITPDSIAANVHIPTIKSITDVTNPEIDKTVDQATFDRAKAKYEGGIRYQELIGWANKYIGSQYRALAESAKAYAAGLSSAVEIEKVYQQFLELVKQQKITAEKGVDYITQSHKTAVKQAGMVYSIAEQEALLSEQKTKAHKAFEKAKSAESEALEFIKGLNEKSATGK
jgi:hypothetical protein